jgi:rod shape determining protein RodA
MMKKNEIYQFDFFLILVVTCVVMLGILTIYSAGFDPIDKINNGMYKRQLLWFILGFIFMIGTTFISYTLLGEYSIFIYGGFLFILIVTTVFATPVRGISAWINFGFFSIQPSEFMKLATIIILAKYIEIRDREIKHFRELLIPSLLILIPIVVIVLQPDLGTAMIFIPVLFVMLFVGGADVTHIVSIISISLISILFPVFFTFLEDKIKGSAESLPFISSVKFWKVILDFFLYSFYGIYYCWNYFSCGAGYVYITCIDD